MRAIQIVDVSGVETALAMAEIAAPEPDHFLTPGDGVVIDVHAAGVSFPEVLQTRGEYQIKPPLPFVPGSEVAGVVVSAPHDSGLEPGQRVAAFTVLGGFAETAVAPAHLAFPLEDELDFRQGAGLILNYHTAYFGLLIRGRLRSGETVLVHGAAGGIGTAALQIAGGQGARTIAVVSSDRKAAVARDAGAEHVVRFGDNWKNEVRAISETGVDVVIDPVGGERFTDSLRTLGEGGRLVVIGFTGGSIPEVRVNRLLLNNIEVIGAGWGAYALNKPEVCSEIDLALRRLIRDGAVAPVVGAEFPLAEAAAALKLLESRSAVGKIVLSLDR